MRKWAGFTLIELLTTLSIIAVLMVILLPVFIQSRKQAHQNVCLSGMRQAGFALLNYVQDYDETFPNGVNRTLSVSGGSYDKTYTGRMWPAEGWAGQCFTYIRNAGILHCPTDSTNPTSPFDSVSSYGFNSNLVDYAEEGDPIPSGVSFATLTAPGHTVLLFEVSGVRANVTTPQEGVDSSVAGTNLSAAGNGLDNRLYAQKDWSTRTENQYATGYLGGRKPFNPLATQFASPAGRHNGRANYVLIDGHVCLLTGNRVSSGRSANAENCPQDNLPSQPGCGGMFQAAGTANPAFTATFSIH